MQARSKGSEIRMDRKQWVSKAYQVGIICSSHKHTLQERQSRWTAAYQERQSRWTAAYQVGIICSSHKHTLQERQSRWTAAYLWVDKKSLIRGYRMRKSGGRGRGRGWSLPARNDGIGGGASGGRGKSNIAPKSRVVEPATSSGYTRPRMLPFQGVGKPLLKPEQQEQVLAFLADSASSSFTSSSESAKFKSSTSSVDVPGQEHFTSLCSSLRTTEKDASGDTTGYSMELFTHTVPGLEREIVNRPCPLQDESDMECTDAQPQPDYYAVPLTQITTLP
ncbi:unnamed protein product [Ranitomeya imitator]|uniref:Uncharacterized protein n=1 Tax=Ranitomeya imitator TaxID=111125 RepID=A0ABN9KTR9_9NEOB|nr:unnamed protein product [Ranitomeya imitator]